MANLPLNYARERGGDVRAAPRPSAAVPSICCGLVSIAAGGVIYYLLHLSGVLSGPLIGVEGGVFILAGLAALCLCLPLSGMAIIMALMSWRELTIRPVVVVGAWLMALGHLWFWLYAFASLGVPLLFSGGP